MRKQFLFPCLLACAVASALALPGRASANMVTNGGFESGGLDGWTQIGDPTTFVSQSIQARLAQCGIPPEYWVTKRSEETS